MDKKVLTDIEKARLAKKISIRKKKKQKIARLTFILIVAVFLYNIVNPLKVFNMSLQFTKSLFSNTKYPLRVGDAENIDIYDYNGDIAVLNKTEVIILNKKGDEIYKLKHNFSNPIVMLNGDMLLVYQPDTGILFFYEKYLNHKKIELQSNVLSANVSKDGRIGYVSSSEKYLNEVTILNKDGKSIYKWYSANEYVSSLIFTQNSNEAYVNCLSTSGGILSTIFYKLNFYNTDEKMKTVLDNFILVGSITDKSNCILIGDSSIITIDNKGNIIKEYLYDGYTLTHFDFDGNKIAISISANNYTNFNFVKVLDYNLNVIYDFEQKSNVIDMYCSKDYVYILSDNSVSRFKINDKEKNVETKKVNYLATSFIAFKNEAYILNSGNINKLEF